MKCENCGKECEEADITDMLDVDGDIAHSNICYECEEIIRSEAEPIATVFYNDDEYPHQITDYNDETESDFSTKYIPTDGWRGYYEVIPSDDWVNIHSDCALSYSFDAEQLKEFDEAFQETLLERNIKYARVFTRTSNVFSTNYDFFVEKGKETETLAIKTSLESKYRDSERFVSTSLTGKDPTEFNENDKAFLNAVQMVK